MVIVRDCAANPDVQGGIQHSWRGKSRKKSKKQSTSKEAALAALCHHIWKCRETLGIWEREYAAEKWKKQSSSEKAVMAALCRHIWKSRDASCILRKNNQPVVSGLCFCFVSSCSKATECHCYHCQTPCHHCQVFYFCVSHNATTMAGWLFSFFAPGGMLVAAHHCHQDFICCFCSKATDATAPWPLRGVSFSFMEHY